VLVICLLFRHALPHTVHVFAVAVNQLGLIAVRGEAD
jgi:hypothetical protein